ncbi:unnamed protein product, partial [Amoebophrya sp. A25]
AGLQNGAAEVPELAALQSQLGQRYNSYRVSGYQQSPRSPGSPPPSAASIAMASAADAAAKRASLIAALTGGNPTQTRESLGLSVYRDALFGPRVTRTTSSDPNTASVPLL